MKKLFIFINVSLMLLAMLLIPKNSLYNYKFSNNFTYVAYINNTQLGFNNSQVIENGNSLIVKTSMGYARYFKDYNQYLMGEALEYRGENTSFALSEIVTKLNAKLVETESLLGINIYYYYSAKLDNYVYKNKTKTNLQIAVSDNMLTAGYPLILHSF